MGDRRGEAFALNNMGSAYSNLGQMEQALEHHTQALEIFRDIGNRRSQGDCLTNLGFIYMERHDIAQATACCEQALAIDREVGDMMGLALDSYNLANLLVQQSRFRELFPTLRNPPAYWRKSDTPTKPPGPSSGGYDPGQACLADIGDRSQRVTCYFCLLASTDPGDTARQPGLNGQDVG